MATSKYGLGLGLWYTVDVEGSKLTLQKHHWNQNLDISFCCVL